MKAYSFYFNASDWLASASVKQMSLAERGAYIGLLAFAWGEKEPGTLPANADKVRRLAEMTPAEWEVSSEAILEKFPLAECGTYRYNPRLIEEVEKQRALSEKNAENGRKSAERRASERAAKEAAAAKAQRNANQNPTTVDQNPTIVEFEANETSTKLSQAKQSTNVDEEREASSSALPLKAEKNDQPLHPAALKAENDGADTFTFAESFFTKPNVYAGVLRTIGFADIDAAHYAREIGLAAADKGDRLTMPAWRKRLTTWLKNDKARGVLLLATANGVRASPDPEADRLRAAQPVTQVQPTAGYTPYVSKPNQPGTVAEPIVPYGPTSTARSF